MKSRNRSERSHWSWLFLPLALACEAPPTPPAPDAATAVDAFDAGTPDASTVPPATRPTLLPALVLSATGVVEVQRGGTGDWVALKIGDAVVKGDSVRTAGDGTVDLSFDIGRMRVAEGSQVTLEILDPRMVRAQVSGHADAEISAGKGEMTLAAAGSDALLKSGAGRFALTSDGRGSTSAAALEGTADMSAGGRDVSLKAGEFETLHKGKLTRAKIPKKVFARGAWPAGLITNRAVLSLVIQASPASRVLVQGKTVEAGENGTYVAQIPLKRGPQKIQIVAVDLLGRRGYDTKVVTMDPDAPSIQGKVEYH
jgi:hypothetical protein